MAAGRKNKYESHIEPNLALIKQMRREGHTERQIMDRIGVSHTTWEKYKHIETEFIEALKHSKENLIAQLEDTLFQQALKGNTTALIFSLKNLAPSKWADKKVVETNAFDDFFKSMGQFEKNLK